MAFKRDGDDTDLLQNLKHRRVSDLLSNFIPDDEATLLRNGRLTCLVCRHRPIFDTLSTLAMHRKGKKHLYELGKYLACKRSHELKQLKADHRDFVRTGVVSVEPLPVPPAQTKLLAHGVPYSSCVRRKTSVLGRKPVLGVSCMPEFDISLSGVTTGAKPSANSQVRKYLKGLWKKRSLEKTVAKCRENYGGKLGHQNIKDVVAESSALKNGQEVRTESVSIVASAAASDIFQDIGAPQSASQGGSRTLKEIGSKTQRRSLTRTKMNLLLFRHRHLLLAGEKKSEEYFEGGWRGNTS
uniref:Sodium channel modifier 1 zinc-finger domain-containing protein n=1 Tax=Timema genevievae TaxID=629358 RepID=A0A7R9K3P9_TIMGE|nr:unnamed protein product [Timema genevievae]